MRALCNPPVASEHAGFSGRCSGVGHLADETRETHPARLSSDKPMCRERRHVKYHLFIDDVCCKHTFRCCHNIQGASRWSTTGPVGAASGLQERQREASLTRLPLGTAPCHHGSLASSAMSATLTGMHPPKYSCSRFMQPEKWTRCAWYSECNPPRIAHVWNGASTALGRRHAVRKLSAFASCSFTHRPPRLN